MTVWDLQSVIFNTVNVYASILAKVYFPPDLTAALQSKLLFKSVMLFLHFSPWSSIFLGHLHQSETCIQGLQEDLQVWLMHRSHVMMLLKETSFNQVPLAWSKQQQLAGH